MKSHSKISDGPRGVNEIMVFKENMKYLHFTKDLCTQIFFWLRLEFLDLECCWSFEKLTKKVCSQIFFRFHADLLPAKLARKRHGHKYPVKSIQNGLPSIYLIICKAPYNLNYAVSPSIGKYV